MKMRKVLSALLVAACTLSLAACGSSSSKSETTGASGETAAGSANTAKVIDWMPFVQNISVMVNLKLLNQQNLTVPKTSWL